MLSGSQKYICLFVAFLDWFLPSHDLEAIVRMPPYWPQSIPHEARSEFTEKESSLHLDIHIAQGA